MMINLHNHSLWSDGSYSIAEIVDYGIRNKLKYLGISDHYLTSKVNSINNGSLQKYIAEINKLKESNRADISLYAGVEIDFTPRTDFKNLDFELLSQLDYVLFEHVQNESEGGLPLWQLPELVDKIGVFTGLAHNNLIKNFPKAEMQTILSMLESKNVFIELNTSTNYMKYGRYYFDLSAEWFENIRNYRIPISIGCDMHENLQDMLNFNIALDFINSNGLDRNMKLLIETLDRIRKYG
ncbi:MAG: PHP domain-containing protein [Thermoplasmata archaeon]